MKKLTYLIAVVFLAGCATAPTSTAERRDLHMDVMDTLETFERTDPGLKDFLNKSYGYALIPTVGKGGFIVGGAYGRGEVYEKGTMIGWCDISQGTVGAQIGGQAYSELLVFETKRALDRFKRDETRFAAQASAVALKSGASADAKFDDGVAVITMAKGGAMLEASIGGQGFAFKPKEADQRMDK
jgi:lipid-binding SYLF domain-containing protein